MHWYEELGYNKNPFSSKPGTNGILLGQDKFIHRLTYQAKIGSLLFIEGPYGSGKTTITKQLRKHFAKESVYFSAATGKSLPVYIQKNRRTWKSMFGIYKKRIILFVDEAHLLEQKDFDYLYELYLMDVFKSILFAGNDQAAISANSTCRSEIKTYKLEEIKFDYALQVLKERIGEQEYLTSLLVKRIFLRAHKNPREYLLALEELFREAVETGKKKITKQMVDEYFKKEKK